MPYIVEPSRTIWNERSIQSVCRPLDRPLILAVDGILNGGPATFLNKLYPFICVTGIHGSQNQSTFFISSLYIVLYLCNSRPTVFIFILHTLARVYSLMPLEILKAGPASNTNDLFHVASSSASKLSFPRVEHVRVPKKRTGNNNHLWTGHVWRGRWLAAYYYCYGNTKKNWINRPTASPSEWILNFSVSSSTKFYFFLFVSGRSQTTNFSLPSIYRIYVIVALKWIEQLSEQP